MSDYPNDAAKQALLCAAAKQIDDARSLLEASGLVPKTEYCIPQWAIVFNTSGVGTRGKRWYHVSRIIQADGKLWELYWHPDLSTRGKNIKDVYNAAQRIGASPIKGVYHEAPSPRYGFEIVKYEKPKARQL